MKIEILYPEFCNLYGDLGNVLFLEKTLKDDAHFTYTHILDKPAFLDKEIDLVYMGALSEKAQKHVLEKLLPYREEILKKIHDGQAMLVTGNAFELFGKYIEEENGNKIECLNVFDTYATQKMMKRWNAFCLADYEDIKIVGFKSQFTESFPIEGSTVPFSAKVQRGSGISKESKEEIVKINNFYATYLLGPLLPVNPLFTKKLLKTLGYEGDLAFEDVSMLAYERRLDDFTNPKKLIDELS